MKSKTQSRTLITAIAACALALLLGQTPAFAGDAILNASGNVPTSTTTIHSDVFTIFGELRFLLQQIRRIEPGYAPPPVIPPPTKTPPPPRGGSCQAAGGACIDDAKPCSHKLANACGPDQICCDGGNGGGGGGGGSCGSGGGTCIDDAKPCSHKLANACGPDQICCDGGNGGGGGGGGSCGSAGGVCKSAASCSQGLPYSCGPSLACCKKTPSKSCSSAGGTCIGTSSSCFDKLPNACGVGLICCGGGGGGSSGSSAGGRCVASKRCFNPLPPSCPASGEVCCKTPSPSCASAGGTCVASCSAPLPNSCGPILLCCKSSPPSGCSQAGGSCVSASSSCSDKLPESCGSGQICCGNGGGGLNPDWWGSGESYTYYNPPTSVTTVLNSWNAILPAMLQHKFQTMRLEFAFSNAQVSDPYYGTPPLNLQIMDAVISLLASKGMNVILDMHNLHDMDGFFGSDTWVQDWVQLAAHYKNNASVVAYEIYNEPYCDSSYCNWDKQYVSSTAQTGAGYLRAIQAIRASGDNHTIVVETPLHSAYAGDASLLSVPNLAYTYHVNARYCQSLGFPYSAAGMTACAQSIGKQFLGFTSQYHKPQWFGELYLNFRGTPVVENALGSGIINFAVQNHYDVDILGYHSGGVALYNTVLNGSQWASH